MAMDSRSTSLSDVLSFVQEPPADVIILEESSQNKYNFTVDNPLPLSPNNIPLSPLLTETQLQADGTTSSTNRVRAHRLSKKLSEVIESSNLEEDKLLLWLILLTILN